MDNDSPPTFDRATYAPGVAAGPACAQCKAALHDRYWRAQNKLLCAPCRAKITAALASARATASFSHALLVGGAVAFACGIAYAIFVQLTHLQLAFITIGIAYAIAKVVRKASNGVSGRRFQILAVVLTYVASAMGYAGPVLTAMKQSHQKRKAAAAATATATASSDGKPIAPPAERSGVAKRLDRLPPLARFIMAWAVIFLVVLAAPLLVATTAPLGLVIVAIGLWQAWKLARPVELVCDGPYDLAPAPPT